ncbi:PREDICTED: VQ motif-containing protein 22-like [Tarenaya hassleriana]|uniref:VQ motif-containing protein 22-like n=1 Tax=Tarenaya hassleriana TaxID=28532 RepID=UPI00053C7C42|nr:PREDICTED: VQ motif-containing protein 22-like [Tarenaya hassleriana]
MANPNDWSQFGNNQSFFTTTASSAGDSLPSPPETGRVSRPARRRSRASRRAPTTRLNTDTSNFRAMVQQYTGGPSAMNFGSGSGFTLTPPSSNPALGAGADACVSGGSHAPPSWQYMFQQQASHAPPPSQPSPYMFSLSNVNSDVVGVIGGVSAAVPGGFFTAEDDGDGGGGGSDQPSQVIGSRNENNSWLQ